MRFGGCRQSHDHLTKLPNIDHGYVKHPKKKIKKRKRSPLAGKMWALTASITNECEIKGKVIQALSQRWQCHIVASYCVLGVRPEQYMWIFKEAWMVEWRNLNVLKRDTQKPLRDENSKRKTRSCWEINSDIKAIQYYLKTSLILEIQDNSLQKNPLRWQKKYM